MVSRNIWRRIQKNISQVFRPRVHVDSYHPRLAGNGFRSVLCQPEGLWVDVLGMLRAIFHAYLRVWLKDAIDAVQQQPAATCVCMEGRGGEGRGE